MYTYQTYIPIRTNLSDLLYRYARNVFDNVLTNGDREEEVFSLKGYSQQEAYNLVVNRYIDKIYRYVRHAFSLDETSANDIVQEIFLHLYKVFDKYDSNQKLEPRLFTIARNVALDQLRKHKRDIQHEIEFSRVEEFVLGLAGQDKVDESVHKYYKNALLKLVLVKLDTRSRELILLYYFEYKTYDEIAIILDINPKSIGTLISRAKKKLRELIETDSILQEALVYDLD